MKKIILIALVLPVLASADILTGLVSHITFDNAVINASTLNIKDEINPAPKSLVMVKTAQTFPLSLADVVPGPKGTAFPLSKSTSPADRRHLMIVKNSSDTIISTGAFYDNGLTVSFWFKPGVSPTQDGKLLRAQLLAHKGDQYEAPTYRIEIQTDGRVSAVSEFETTHFEAFGAVSQNSIIPGKWNHFAYVCERLGSMKSIVFLNGVKSVGGDCMFRHQSSSTSGPLYLGEFPEYRWAFDYDPFVGSIDDYRVYSRSLKDTDIAELGQNNGYLLNWTFNSPLSTPIATLISDRSGENTPTQSFGSVSRVPNAIRSSAPDSAALSLAGSFSNTGYITARPVDWTLVGKSNVTFAVGLNPRSLPQTGRSVFSQMTRLSNNQKSGVFEISLVPNSLGIDSRTLALDLNIGGTIHRTVSIFSEVPRTAWTYVRFHFDGRCVRFYYGYTNSNVWNTTNCVVPANQPPQSIAGDDTMPIVGGGRWNHASTAEALFIGDIDELSIREGFGEVPPEFCGAASPPPQPLSEKMLPGGLLELVWSPYLNRQSDYFVEVQSTSTGFGTSASFDRCYTTPEGVNLCVAQASASNSVWTSNGPNYRWRVTYVNYDSSCANNTPSAWRSFSLTSSLPFSPPPVATESFVKQAESGAVGTALNPPTSQKRESSFKRLPMTPNRRNFQFRK